MHRRAIIPLLALVLVALALATLLSGEGILLVPAVILLLIVGAMSLAELGLHKRLERRYDGDLDRAMADNTDPIPNTHHAVDAETPLGDTSEAHDEVSPHDLPKDHPGRAQAEHEAEDRFERTGERVTRGNR